MIVRNNKGEPCESCRVQLVSENEDAAKVLMMVRHQVCEEHTKDGIIIDLSLPAVKIAMDVHGIRNQLDCAERVRHAWYALREQEE